ncbi:hypothetical protein M0Q97_01030 [Candidatus Dojkabacteria bacterium]|jgi:hypothetical protein|nr:hypothetical protein [Candidatus Dojkabacteria bacterium]
MEKQLIIIVYKINIDGLSKALVEQHIAQLHQLNSLINDEELKENFLIREIWLPVTTETDVKVIYPLSLNDEQMENLINDLKSNIIT